MDSVNYILKVFHSVVKPEDDITITVCKKNYNNSARPVLLIFMRGDDHPYIYIDPNADDFPMTQYTKSEIKKMFKNKELSYLDDQIIEGFDIDDDRTIKR